MPDSELVLAVVLACLLARLTLLGSELLVLAFGFVSGAACLGVAGVLAGELPVVSLVADGRFFSALVTAGASAASVEVPGSPAAAVVWSGLTECEVADVLSDLSVAVVAAFATGLVASVAVGVFGSAAGVGAVAGRSVVAAGLIAAMPTSVLAVDGTAAAGVARPVALVTAPIRVAAVLRPACIAAAARLMPALTVLPTV